MFLFSYVFYHIISPIISTEKQEMEENNTKLNSFFTAKSKLGNFALQKYKYLISKLTLKNNISMEKSVVWQ